ncbi:MAG TPA: hypothetical protein DCY52_08070, partial [Methylococcaceae bacterium]|nr:hypothetical protein [Methylococcaceae bacterium]
MSQKRKILITSALPYA